MINIIKFQKYYLQKKIIYIINNIKIEKKIYEKNIKYKNYFYLVNLIMSIYEFINIFHIYINHFKFNI